MHRELQILSVSLAKFLEKNLPHLSENWWLESVIEQLTYQQRAFARERKASSLRDFDLAALLRILDRNWNQLSVELALPRDGRNWVKELQAVRIKWAPNPAGEPPASEVFRDADTLERLLTLISADKKSIEAIRSVKAAALAKMTSGAGTMISSTVEPLTHAAKHPREERPQVQRSEDGAPYLVQKGLAGEFGDLKRLNRPMIRKDWMEKGIILAIATGGTTYKVPHDQLLKWVSENLNALKTQSWQEKGLYSWPHPSKKMLAFLRSDR